MYEFRLLELAREDLYVWPLQDFFEIFFFKEEMFIGIKLWRIKYVCEVRIRLGYGTISR